MRFYEKAHPKDFMGLGKWILSKIDKVSSSAHVREIEDFTIRLKGMDADEIAHVVVIMTCMRHRLIKAKMLPEYSLKFFIETQQTQHELLQAMSNIGDMIRENQKMGNMLACAGMFPWRHTLGCVIRQELRHYGKEMWKELSRGFDLKLLEICMDSIAVSPRVRDEIMSLDDPEKELTFIPEMLNPFKN